MYWCPTVDSQHRWSDNQPYCTLTACLHFPALGSRNSEEWGRYGPLFLLKKDEYQSDMSLV